jgi:SAM-dependent methyltransferase
MAVISQCPVCGHSETSLFLDGDDSLTEKSIGSSRQKLSPGRILRCRNCGLAFRSFRPSPEELARLYRQADDRVYEAERHNRFRTARRHQGIVEKFVTSPGRVIDVGCASGSFLRVMADRGWDVIGVEPSPSQAARATELLAGRGQIHQDILEHADLPESVNLLTLWDVLEHVVEPRSFLRKCATLLQRDGVLALNVPRIDSFIAKLMGQSWPLLLAEHLNYFTLKSLRLCAADAGLNLIAWGTRPVSFSFDYVLFRLSQHGLPTGVVSKFASAVGLEQKAIPIWMGEVYAIYRRL